MKDRLNSHEAYTILFSPRSLTGALLKHNPATGMFHLRSLQHAQLHNLELERLTLFNPTAIGSIITQWYAACDQATPLLFALHGPAIEEHMLLLHTAHPNDSHFPISHAPHLSWKHTYLYSLDHRHCFYLCGMPKPLLFQYQLMAIEHNLPLTLLTTERMALAHCYRAMNGAAYRPAQLAHALQMQHNRIERLFFKEDLSRMLIIPSHIKVDDSIRLPLLAACGLFAMQGL
ncbi:MAG: hypothetical protein ACD_64C00105G0003 [uncultured bacterium]|nr:MAG: hypothetical protein ACD_64C00105G0003 [uncultured bacterium]